MKKTVLILCLFILSALLAVQAQQGEARMTVNIAGAMPMGQLKDLVDKTSFRGGDIILLYGITDRLAAGLNAGFQDFYQKYPRATYKLADGSDISAVITNSIQTIPFLATVKYDFMPQANLRPYVSGGIGGTVVLNQQYIGEYASENNKISFAARPSAGVYIPFKKQGEAGLNIAVNYTYIPFKQDDISNLSFIGFTVGIGFPVRD